MFERDEGRGRGRERERMRERKEKSERETVRREVRRGFALPSDTQHPLQPVLKL